MNDVAEKKPPTLLILLILYGSLIMAIFNYTLSIIASIYIVSDLGGGTSTVIYNVSYFAIGNAVGIPLGGYLLFRWGIYRPIVTCTLIFAFFAWGSAYATTYETFLLTRFLQGFICGPYYALILTLLNHLIPARYQKVVPVFNGCIFIVTPVLGATWGGWISYEWDWRILYYCDIPLALGFALLQLFYLKGFDHLFLRKVTFDRVGYVLFTCAVICLSLFIVRGQELDWMRSSLLSFLFPLGVCSLIFFILWELGTEQPILDLRLLKDPVLSFGLFHLAVLFGVYFGNIILLSLWLKFWANYTTWWLNLLLFNTAVAALAIFAFRALFALKDTRYFWSLSIVLLALSAFYTTYFNIEIDFQRIAFSRILAGFGLAFFLPPIFRLCYSVYPSKYVDVLSLVQVARALGSGLGAAIFTTLWQRRQVFFNERLVSRLTPFSSQTDDYYSNVGLIGLEGEAATAQLDYFTQRVASSLALDDSFYLMGYLLVIMLLSFILTYFMPQTAFNPK